MKILLLTFWLIINPSKQEIATTDGGKIKFYNTECYTKDGVSDGSICDIILEKYTDSGKLEWKTKIGGNSWDYVEAVLEVANGYLVLGNTSSYGVGNLDVYLTKLDANGKEQWFRTYGGFFNDYGRTIAPSGDADGGYIIKGEKQHCIEQNVSEKCYTKPLFIKVAENGDNLYEE
jgi:hypothetical protein